MRAVSLVALLAGISPLAQAGNPLGIFNNAGQDAQELSRLVALFGGVSIAVIVLIALLLISAIWHRRTADTTGGRPQRDEGGMPWIYWGVGLSAVVLIICMLFNLKTIAATSTPADDDGALTVHVTAHQWWWELTYQDPDSHKVFLSANEIHIPVGRKVKILLDSADVIHSFWVPSLAGKMDVIPGQTNVTWVQADEPGVYRGECAVFCGAEHARMEFRVVAQDPKDFAAWRSHQLEDAPQPQDAATLRGRLVFESRCAACHTLRGSSAAGMAGPDLTHLMDRSTLAAGVLPNDAGHLAEWIRDPQKQKPGTEMPQVPLSETDLAAIVAYLRTTH
ncbi:MAG TPA: cytochrome c oxidase subunit II [Gammaproteobacteria bacterium]|nr:cytochrome c oxidase subunit II [Gammaproteobacteria bacterium]